MFFYIFTPFKRTTNPHVSKDTHKEYQYGSIAGL